MTATVIGYLSLLSIKIREREQETIMHVNLLILQAHLHIVLMLDMQ